MTENDTTEIFTKSNINNAEDYLKNLETGKNSETVKNSTKKTDNYFQYNIENCLKTDFHEIKLKEDSHINFCCFRIIESTKYSQVLHPYLQYLLFKYPTNKGKESNLCIFPFKEYKKNMNILDEGKTTIKKIFGKQHNCIGYTIHNEELYLFYNIDYIKSAKVVMKKDEKFWWALIDEICNHNKILNFPVHESVYNLFYNNPCLIHLKNRKGQYIETPFVLYNGEYFNKLPYLYIIGLKSSTHATFGPFYYFTDYMGAFRRGGWSTNYKMIKINNKLITDENGMYKKGGIIRYSAFLGKSRIILNDKNDNYRQSIINDDFKKRKEVIGKWAKKYDSIVANKIKIDKEIYYNQFPYIVTKNLENINALTIHEIDMSSLKANWDPLYTGYRIL